MNVMKFSMNHSSNSSRLVSDQQVKVAVQTAMNPGPEQGDEGILGILTITAVVFTIGRWALLSIA